MALNQNPSNQHLVNTIDSLIHSINEKPRNQAKVWITPQLHADLITQNSSLTIRIPRIQEDIVQFRIYKDDRGCYIEYYILDEGYETPIDIEFDF